MLVAPHPRIRRGNVGERRRHRKVRQRDTFRLTGGGRLPCPPADGQVADRDGHEVFRPGQPRMAHRGGHLRHHHRIPLCRLAQNLFWSPPSYPRRPVPHDRRHGVIVMSRTSILDGFLAMFALAAFLCVVMISSRHSPARFRPLAEWDGLGEPGWGGAPPGNTHPARSTPLYDRDLMRETARGFRRLERAASPASARGSGITCPPS